MRLVRDYARVFHTPTSGLLAMPLSELAEEVSDASAELDEEAKRLKRDQERAEKKARSRSRRRR